MLRFMEVIDIDSLSAEERLQLLEQVWESLSETPQAIPFGLRGPVPLA